SKFRSVYKSGNSQAPLGGVNGREAGNYYKDCFKILFWVYGKSLVYSPLKSRFGPNISLLPFAPHLSLYSPEYLIGAQNELQYLLA
ncbi:MAG TPA: hypothetical protein VNF06_00595, partial [Candidatus Aquilonibacter sp.]|nr:hypothetical protein [Candidatus Aquilonibacter sp.]